MKDISVEIISPFFHSGQMNLLFRHISKQGFSLGPKKKYILYLCYVWDKITDKTVTVIAYALLPITYPIHVYQMKQLDKKLAQEKIELEKIRKKNLLR